MCSSTSSLLPNDGEEAIEGLGRCFMQAIGIWETGLDELIDSLARWIMATG
jgi:hypothetical protein